MKRKILYAAGICLVVIAGISFYFLRQVNQYKQEVQSIQINEPSLTEKADGKYLGDCDVGFVYAKVEVTVKNHEITDIKLLEHKNGKGKAAEKIPARVISAQSLQVDAVAGATSSSKVILKAIDNALE